MHNLNFFYIKLRSLLHLLRHSGMISYVITVHGARMSTLQCCRCCAANAVQQMLCSKCCVANASATEQRRCTCDCFHDAVEAAEALPNLLSQCGVSIVACCCKLAKWSGEHIVHLFHIALLAQAPSRSNNNHVAEEFVLGSTFHQAPYYTWR